MLGRGLRAAVACSLVAVLGCAGTDLDAPQQSAPARSAPDAAPEETPAPCVRRAPTLQISAESDASVPAGTPVTYTLSITNENEPSCAPEVFYASVSPPVDGLGFGVEPLSVESGLLAGGETSDSAILVTSGAEEDAATYALRFFVHTELSDKVGEVHVASAQTEYVVGEPEGCHVVPSRELLIRHLSVVDDASRTLGDGAWTFGRLMRRLAADAPALTEGMFESFTSPQLINGFKVAARPNMRSTVLEPWPRTAAGELDLSRAPLRLLAIAHRLDLADLARGRAGEGRFVYGVLDRNGGPLLFTVILEYALLARGEAEQRAWARDVHALSEQAFPGAGYNAALQALTDRYATRDALLRIRTNENALGRDGRWEMREFHLSPETGALVPAALAQTPDTSFNKSPLLARYMKDNRESILRETFETPAVLEDAPFAAGALINQLDYWQAPDISDPELRHKFSLNTCDGCHGGETFTSFFHVLPRPEGLQSRLSSFLTGSVVQDPETGIDRSYNELARRRQLLERDVCGE
ncbi:MAG TPA: hypothetical protein VJV78_38680 [Polyangiales bacterium]|nr:hypothetical protein [Polyangiales bacterium]